MKTIYPNVAFLWIFMLFFFSCIPVFAKGIEEVIYQGDLAFNQGRYNDALQRYQNAYAQLAQNPPSPLSAEVMNNIAATYMAQGNLEEFHWHFQRAKAQKQQFAGRLPPSHTDHNLLINGGFEDGLIFPWGTGHYERTDGKFQFGIWWNSKNAKAFMKIDTAEKYAGKRSLRITNYSPAEPHVFTTLSQRVSGLEPNTVYRISCSVKSRNYPKSTLFFTVDPGWQKRDIRPRAGTYDWERLSKTVNIGHNNYIDLRIVLEDVGTLWLDEIVVEKVAPFEDLDPFQRAESLFDLAKYDEALQAFSNLYEQNPKNWNLALYIGRIHLILGEYDQAFEKLNELVHRKNSLAAVYLGELYYHLGDYDMAESLFKKALGPLKGNQAGESLVMNNLSRTYLAKGDLKEASKYQYSSLYVFQHIGDQHGQALALNQLGLMYQRSEEYDSAEKPFREAYQLVEKLGDDKLRSDIVLNIAETAYLNRQWDKARQHVVEVLQIKEAIHDQLGRMRALHLMGRLDTQEKKLNNALENYRQAVNLLENVSAGIEDISREAKTTFVRQFSRLYREYVDLLLQFYQQSKDPEYHREAFRASEQARSRVFTEMITEARAMQAFSATSTNEEFSQLLKAEREGNVKIHVLTKQMQKAKVSAQLEKAWVYEQRLAEIRQQNRNIQNRLRKNYPRYADLKNPKPLHIQEVQELLASDEAVLSYFVTPNQTALWAITKEEVVCFALPFGRRELLERSTRFYEVFANIADEISQFDPIFGPPDQKYRLRSAFARYSPKTAHDLYQLLVAQAESVFRTKRVVYLTLDDFLYKLPFEALLTKPFPEDHENKSIMGGSLTDAPFWVKTHTISYLPSLSVLRSLRTLEKKQQGGQEPFIAFADPVFSSDQVPQSGNTFTRSVYFRKAPTHSGKMVWELPPLPDTRDEALEVAKILGGSSEQDVYLQKRAIEENVKTIPLNQYNTLLFATHALLAGEFGPGTQPALALSFVGDQQNDGLLEMGEILGLNLNADLVVLSACNTAGGSGKDDHGEGFAGLTRSFMYAGARSLFVTQWSVESSSARTLVRNTFNQMRTQLKGDALALSKREMIKSRELLKFGENLSASPAHPYFWAPYILVGEAK
ncbi:MAG: CHAT domain-containing protein [Candidatus Electrothrix communis]|nr:MAG: CHAT domain-containing protein [Candidatus Electrothrix communis]